MNILFLWDGEYPWDIRVEKVCNSLLKAGHQIHLVCRNQNARARDEFYRGLHIHRIASLPKPLAPLNGPFTFPAFFSPVWLFRLLEIGRRERCGLIIVRDLPMSPAALLVGKLLKLPVVLDMAECYPEMLRCAWEFERFRISNVFVRHPAVADVIEKFVLKRVDHVFVMVEESLARLRAMGIDEDRISIVSNTPDEQKYSDVPVVPQVSENLRVIYVGLLNPSRGVDTLLDAAAILKSIATKFSLQIVGSGKHSGELSKRADMLGLLDHVHFTGWIENTRIPAMLAEADVGVVPHYSCSHWNTTIPNKLFDYMAAGKPVIVSDATPTARIVRETQCGLVYPSRDPQALAAAIRRLQDPNFRRELGANGRRAIESRYNWRHDEEGLIAVANRYAYQ